TAPARSGRLMLLLIRHGRTDANASGLLLGRADPSLDDEGRRQAACLAAVASSCIKVVCSPLARARETAALLRPDLSPVVDERWIELDYGELDGRPFGEVPAELWSAWRADPAYVPAGGESLVSLGARVEAACSSLAREAEDADIAVVTHVSPVKAAVAWALR